MCLGKFAVPPVSLQVHLEACQLTLDAAVGDSLDAIPHPAWRAAAFFYGIGLILIWLVWVATIVRPWHASAVCLAGRLRAALVFAAQTHLEL